MNWKILSIFIVIVIIAGVGGYFIVIGNPLTVTRTVGEMESSFLIQNITPDSVEGLWYQSCGGLGACKSTPKTLHIGDDIGHACGGVSEKLTSIDFSGQKVTFAKIVGEPTDDCPICLSGNTLIDTPDGNINIKELKKGMPVWTSDSLGHRQPAIILKIGKAQVPPTHKMAYLVLDNGRELFGSQGHPTADGRTFGDVKPDDVIDNSYVKSVEIVPYGQEYTYDILPSGDTGFYWANGVLVGSTLK